MLFKDSFHQGGEFLNNFCSLTKKMNILYIAFLKFENVDWDFYF